MANAKKIAADDDEVGLKSQVKSKVNRGTQDDLEILMIIIKDSPMLKTGVLERIRAGRKRAIERREYALKKGRD